jgi:hypothetical protein
VRWGRIGGQRRGVRKRDKGERKTRESESDDGVSRRVRRRAQRCKREGEGEKKREGDNTDPKTA